MKVITIKIEKFDKNLSYILRNNENEALLIDPSDFESSNKILEEQDLKLKSILITHSHFDHIADLNKFINFLPQQIEVYGHKKVEKKITGINNFIPIADGDYIFLRDQCLKVIETPGHIDDAVCYFLAKEFTNDGVSKIFTGDTLFVEGCGRADFEESNVQDLYNSLNKLKALNHLCEVLAGHDYGSKIKSTIGEELKNNKYMLAKSFDEFKELRLPSQS